MSFFNDFMGKSQQKDLSNANQQAQGYLSSGLNNATSSYNSGADKAQGYYGAYAQNGNNANALYGNAIGLNGQGNQQSAYQTYQQNPFLQAQQGSSDRAIYNQFQRYNAQGMGNSGMSRLATARTAQDNERTNQTDWLNRLQGLQGQGLQVAGQQAGIEQNRGQYLGDLQSGYGQQMAGNAINFGNATAASRSTGINNLLGLAGMGVNAYATYKRPTRTA